MATAHRLGSQPLKSHAPVGKVTPRECNNCLNAVISGAVKAPLKQIRSDLALTPQIMAMQIGLSPRRYRALEAGMGQLDKAQYERLCQTIRTQPNQTGPLAAR